MKLLVKNGKKKVQGTCTFIMTQSKRSYSGRFVLMIRLTVKSLLNYLISINLYRSRFRKIKIRVRMSILFSILTREELPKTEKRSLPSSKLTTTASIFPKS